MLKLGKKNEGIETIEAYRGHMVDCSGVEVCDCNSTRNKYDENDRVWWQVAW